jgi:Collagen triple helix repeat (20 copies)
MIKRIHNQLGAAGLTIAVLALIVALAGTAFAAKQVFTKAQEKKIVKIAKKYAGKNGKNGAAGPAGAPGAKGDTGAKGETGSAGEPGSDGEPGNPWTAGGTLPSGATETGAWALGQSADAGSNFLGLSFSIPLAAALGEDHVHFINSDGKEENGSSEVTSTVCLGSAGDPTAAAGHLCVYAGTLLNTTSKNASLVPPSGLLAGTPGADTSGAVLVIEASEAFAIATGTFAVTAP